MDHLQKQSDMKLQNLTHAGERKNWNFGRFVTVHKEQHTMLEGLTDHVHNGLYNRTKVTHMMDSVKVDSLNTVTAMILANRDFCKDFDNSFTLYKDFLNQSNSTASDTGRV